MQRNSEATLHSDTSVPVWIFLWPPWPPHQLSAEQVGTWAQAVRVGSVQGAFPLHGHQAYLRPATLTASSLFWSLLIPSFSLPSFTWLPPAFHPGPALGSEIERWGWGLQKDVHSWDACLKPGPGCGDMSLQSWSWPGERPHCEAALQGSNGTWLSQPPACLPAELGSQQGSQLSTKLSSAHMGKEIRQDKEFCESCGHLETLKKIYIRQLRDFVHWDTRLPDIFNHRCLLNLPTCFLSIHM